MSDAAAPIREPRNRFLVAGMIATGITAIIALGFFAFGSIRWLVLFTFFWESALLAITIVPVVIFAGLFWSVASGLPTFSITHGLIPAVQRRWRGYVGGSLCFASILAIIMTIGAP